MEVAFTVCVTITDSSSVGEARRSAAGMAQKLGFDESRAGELALLATEVARNVLVHGGGGQVIFAGQKDREGPSARIVAIDSGPGISDIARALDDGFSTAGTMGAGLGAMKRMASAFEVFTGPGGTIVFLEVGEGRKHSLQIAGLTCPYPGESVCGDGWTYHRETERTVVLLTDGLGHGLGAAEAAWEAAAVFHDNIQLSPGEMLSSIHDTLRKTRGAVASVVEIRSKDRKLTYCGVGNISAVLLNGNGSRNLVSHNGTLGHFAPRIQEFKSEWSPHSTLILHSDGVQTRWDLSSYAGLIARHPAVIGGALLRDFRRQRDDASVVVIKAT